MNQITSIKDYEKIIAQNNITAAVLFYIEDDIDCSIAEVKMNNLSKKYSSEMLFTKIAFDQKQLVINNQLLELPVIQIINDGYQSFYRNPIQYEILDSKILGMLEIKEYSTLSNLPPRTERIKKGLLERKWIAWSFVIGAALIAIVKFLIELDNSNNKKR